MEGQGDGQNPEARWAVGILRLKDYDKIFIARTKGKRKLFIVKLYLTLPPLSLCKLSSLLWEIWILLYTFIAKALFMVNPGNEPKRFKELRSNSW